MGEEHGDDDDGSKVVGDGQGEQKCSDRLWHSRSGDGQDRQGEGDVGGHRDRPASRVPARGQGIDEGVDPGREEHSAHCSDDRHHRICWAGQ